MLAQPVRAVAPAWRPGAPHTLAWVGASGRVEVRDVDTGALVWRSPASVGAVRALAWSADGHRLLARGAAARRRLRRDGQALLARAAARAAPQVGAAAWAPRGDRIALALRGAHGHERLRHAARRWCPGRPVFTTTGTLRSLAWSPNGRRLLVRWADADQWLAALPQRRERPDHRDRLDLAPLRQRPPTVQGWCCA